MNTENEYRQAIEEYLDSCFCEPLTQHTVLEAMRYSLLAGGKRVRPVLLLEFTRICGGDWKKAVPVACALEMIHTYSLIHDDLPCMDNDDYRRGKLTNHKVYGEATAVLAGDGLLTAAFYHAAAAGYDRTADIVKILSECAGPYGMVGGQQLDLEFEGKHCEANVIKNIHSLKTAALLRAACLIGTVCGGADEEKRRAAEQYAESIGLAFQLRDDILDVTGSFEQLGKKTGMDENKNTFVHLYGIKRCEEMISEETASAIRALSVFPQSDFLEEFAKKLAVRSY